MLGADLCDLHWFPNFFHLDLPGVYLWYLGVEQIDDIADDVEHKLMLNDQLMAVPLFILMGIVMEAAALWNVCLQRSK